MTSTLVGLHRYPIKSMLGEELQEARLTELGLEGDRAWGVVDLRTRELVSCKRPKRWSRMFELRACLQASSGPWVTFPDGRTLHCDDPQLETALSQFLGRAVGLVEQAGAFFDLAEVHLLTTRSLASLRERSPDTGFELSRFRPNLVVETDAAGDFPEDQWEGREATLGEVRLRLETVCPRCVMTDLPQADLPADPSVLKALRKHHRRPFDEVPVPALGLYARVLRGGRLRRGDRLVLG